MNDGYWSDPDRADRDTKKLWNHEREERLIELWEQDVPAQQIGKELGVTKRSVQRHVAKYRDRLGLEPRTGRFTPGRPQKLFEKEWHGVVPFGHWTITKPWSVGNGKATEV
jgi:predicted ArsR family transcriptional regulator